MRKSAPTANRRAKPQLTELGELIHVLLHKVGHEEEPPPIPRACRRRIGEILTAIAADIDVRDWFFDSVRNSPGNSEIRDKKFYAELDYRLSIAAGAHTRGLREGIRKRWGLTTEQMRRAGLEHKKDCESIMLGKSVESLRQIVEIYRARHSARSRPTSRTVDKKPA